jgi:hypothetical protein
LRDMYQPPSGKDCGGESEMVVFGMPTSRKRCWDSRSQFALLTMQPVTREHPEHCIVLLSALGRIVLASWL